MSLERIIYYSRPHGSFTHSDTLAVLEAARANNARMAVTGLLGFRPGLFVQVLEGERETVAELFAKIATDPRHHEVRLVGMAPIESRQFSSWSMGYISLHQASRERILKYSASGEFDPSKLSAQQVSAILADFDQSQRDRLDNGAGTQTAGHHIDADERWAAGGPSS